VNCRLFPPTGCIAAARELKDGSDETIVLGHFSFNVDAGWVGAWHHLHQYFY
jgi:hypothetical protein